MLTDTVCEGGPQSQNGCQKSILYVSYDGILEPLGYSQVFSYLKGLALKGWKIYLISFEKKVDWEAEECRNRLRTEAQSAGIRWFPLRYHKHWPLMATIYDVGRGIILAVGIVAVFRVKVVHARSYVAAAIALFLKTSLRTKFVFDMRGFWVDERIDAGIWSRPSTLYGLAKRFERRLLVNADTVISLARTAVNVLQTLPYLKDRNAKYAVVPTCVDLVKFQPRPDRPQYPDLRDDFVVGYVGSVKLWYMFDMVLDCLAVLLRIRTGARLLILNRGDHEFIKSALQNKAIPLNRIDLRSAAYHQVPGYMKMMNAGVFFIRPTFSKVASSPTKLGEFLGSGIPCLTNTGIGDVDEILLCNNVGVLLEEFTPAAFESAWNQIFELVDDHSTSARCRKVAETHFSLERGIQIYDEVYRKLSGAGAPKNQV